MYKEVLSHFLPEGIPEYFEITSVKEKYDESSKKKKLEIYLEEINQIPTGNIINEYESKGFYNEKTIHDFPARAKVLDLVIKRRRWRHKENHSEIKRDDYPIIAKSSKITKELSDFLKDTDR
jgi:hypothetical protein